MLSLLALILAVSADAACPDEHISVAKVAETSDTMTAAYQAMDGEAFDASFRQLTEYVGCMDEIIRPADAAQIHALYGYNAFVKKDRNGALRSFQVAVSLDKSFAPPESIAPVGGAMRELFEKAQTRPEVAMVAFGAPGGQQAFVDGSSSARRPISAPTIVQLKQDQKVTYSAYLTTEDALPGWMPSARDALIKAVGDEALDELSRIRLGQQDNIRLLGHARNDHTAAADKDWAQVQVQARAGGEEGKAALHAFIGQYSEGAVVVNGVKRPSVIPHVATARLWMDSFDSADGETRALDTTLRIDTAAGAVKKEAAAEWATVEELILAADYSGREALDAFVKKFGTAAVEAGGHRNRIAIEQLDAASDWLEIYELAAAKLPDSTDSLALAIEIADERAKAGRDAVVRVTEATTALLKAANDDWKLTLAFANTDPDAGKAHVQRFLDRYERATVDIDGAVAAVEIPQLADAREWLANPPTAAVAVVPEPEPTKPADAADPPEDPVVAVADPDPVVGTPPVDPGPTVATVAQPQPVYQVPGQPPGVVVISPGASGFQPVDIPSKARALKTGVALGIVGAAAHVGAYVARGYYDEQYSEELYMTTDGAYIGSLALGGLSAVFTTVGIVTPSIKRKQERRAIQAQEQQQGLAPQ